MLVSFKIPNRKKVRQHPSHPQTPYLETALSPHPPGPVNAPKRKPTIKFEPIDAIVKKPAPTQLFFFNL